MGVLEPQHTWLKFSALTHCAILPLHGGMCPWRHTNVIPPNRSCDRLLGVSGFSCSWEKMKKHNFAVLDGTVHPQFRDTVRVPLRKGSREEKGINAGALLRHLWCGFSSSGRISASLQARPQPGPFRKEGMGQKHPHTPNRIASSGGANEIQGM